MVTATGKNGWKVTATTIRFSSANLIWLGAAAIFSSISFARVARAGLGDEYDVERIIWAVPDPSCARDLVLSRLERLALDGARAQVASHSMLPTRIGPVTWLSGSESV